MFEEIEEQKKQSKLTQFIEKIKETLQMADAITEAKLKELKKKGGNNGQ